MKIISKLSKLLPLLFLAVVLNSCSDDDDGNVVVDDPTIVDIAVASPDLSILVEALIAADGDLPGVLSGDGPFTVLAPTNAAFENFLSENGFADLDDVPTDVLATVLMNHVIAADVRSSDLVSAGAGYESTLAAAGPDNKPLSLYFDTSSGVTFNGVANVETADVVASNGTIHIIDAVIGLPTVVDFATSNPALSSLVAALSLADSQADSPMLIPTLDGNGSLSPFTVFAPTNDAFDDLLLELDPDGTTELGDLDAALVESVLYYHVVANANVTSDQLSNGVVSTIGGDITLDAGALTLTDENGRVSNIVPSLVDIQATNGVVHVIDMVILPPL